MVPVILIVTALIGVLGIPEHLAFSASKNELAAMAKQSLYNQPQATSGWAGVYNVDSCEHIADGVILHLSGASSISFKFSLGYFPDTPPKKRGEWLETDHYHGPWYIMKYYAL